MVKYLPINLMVSQQSVLVVGAGQVAYRKIKLLMEADARLTIVAPQIEANIQSLAGVSLINRDFQDDDIIGKKLIFAATNNQELNQHIAHLARTQGVLVNVVDEPANCDFIMPSILREGPLTISVSTSGQAPILARHIAQQLGRQVDHYFADYVALVAKIRKLIYQQIDLPSSRLALMEEVIQLNLLDQIKNNQVSSPEKIVEELVSHVR